MLCGAPSHKRTTQTYQGNPERSQEITEWIQELLDTQGMRTAKKELGVGLDHSDTDCKTDEPWHIMNFESLHQLTSMGFDRFDAQIEMLAISFVVRPSAMSCRISR